jgi:hypothetical protein
VIGEHGQQLLRIDIGGQGTVQRHIEFFGMAAAGGVENSVNCQCAIVGAEQQHILAGQRLGFSRVEGELFEFTPRDLAIIAQNFPQGRHDVGIGANAGLVEGFAHQGH